VDPDAVEKTRAYRGEPHAHPDGVSVDVHHDRVIADVHPDRVIADAHPDRVIADLADRQHAVVAVWQLIPLGISDDAVLRRAASGRLHRKHRGVYAVGHATLTPKGHRMAAVLAYGPDAVLSHRSAAAHWGIWSAGSKIDITTAGARRSRAKIRAHRAVLHPEDMTVRDGIPITSVPRTILDLAARVTPTALANLIEEADRAELLNMRALERAISRRPRVAGVARLRAALADYRGPADTRSRLERDFRAFIVRNRLPEPQFNALVEGLTVDVYWPQWRLVVELDGRRYHANPRAFETDRVRDAILQKADLRVLRVTRKRLDTAQADVLADILALKRP
jgi:very-short-patch-repair endonuclease